MRTILLADDEAHLRALVRATLEGDGIRVVEAADGDAALRLALTERPDLVVLDWRMPGSSGLEVLARLRREPATAALPVIMLTALGEDADRARAGALGASAYLMKPFSPLQLLEIVEGLLGQGLPAEREDPVVKELPADPSQLGLFVRDLRIAVEAERERSRQLAEANARLELLDRLKSEFLGFISHELRTPLHHMSVVDVLDPAAAADEQREAIRLVRAGYDRLSRLVERGLRYFDWLARSVDTSGSCDLSAVARTVIEERSDAFAAGPDEGAGRRETLTLSAPAAGPVVAGQEAHLREVVAALVDTAVDLGVPGEAVDLVISAVGERARLQVRGLAPGEAGEVFPAFAVTGSTDQAKRSAMGMALASAIVEGLGGELVVEEDPAGTGRSLRLEVPLRP